MENVIEKNIIQHNAITMGRYSFSPLKSDIIALLTLKVNEDPSAEYYEVELKKLTELKGKKVRYTSAKKVAEEMTDAKIIVNWKDVKGTKYEKIFRKPSENKSDNDFVIIDCFHKPEYEENKGVILVSVDNDFKIFLHDLFPEGNTTIYQLKKYVNLSSTYSKRFYLFLSRFQDTGFFTVGLEKLKEMLELSDKYPQFKEFNRRVLTPAKKEINEKTDFFITEVQTIYESTSGRGKGPVKTINIKFKVKDSEKYQNSINKKVEATYVSVDQEVEESEELKLLKALKELGISEKQSNLYILNKDHSGLWKKINYVKKRLEDNKVNNTAAYLTRLIADDAEIVSPIKTEKKKRNVQQQKLNFENKKERVELEKVQKEFTAKYEKQRLDIANKILEREDENVIGQEILEKTKSFNPLCLGKYDKNKTIKENLNSGSFIMSNSLISAIEMIFSEDFKVLNDKALPYMDTLSKRIAELER